MPSIHRFTTAEAADDLLSEVRGLLFESFPGTFSEQDWEHTLGGQHVVIADGGEIVSHAAVVARTLWIGDRAVPVGYVEGVATRPAHQLQGLGSLAVGALSDLLRADFTMGALSTSQQAFYDRLGWERWQGPTFVRQGTETIRTAAEDAGIMVLRFGQSADVDVADSLTCEAREGDDW